MSTHTIEMSAAEQERAIGTARELAREFAEVGAACDATNRFPFSLVAPYKASGLAGIAIPMEYGGGGADIWTLTRISLELAKGDPACALAFNMHQVMIGILKGLMGPADRERWLPRIASERLLVCGGFSEDRAGLMGLADTTAAPDGAGWRIDGRKSWATLCQAADIVTFNATLTDDDGALPAEHGRRAAAENVFIAEMATPGISIEETWDAHGMRATGTNTIHFDGAVVPAAASVGDFRGGLFSQFEWAAMLFSGVYQGLAEKAYDETRAILRKKSLGATMEGADVALKDVGSVQYLLGKMLVDKEISGRTLAETCRILNEGRDADWDPVARIGLLDVVKVATTGTALEVATTGMRLVGGSTLRRGHVLERLYRDARSGPFQPLTTDQTYNHLGRFELGLLDAPEPAVAAREAVGV